MDNLVLELIRCSNNTVTHCLTSDNLIFYRATDPNCMILYVKRSNDIKVRFISPDPIISGELGFAKYKYERVGNIADPNIIDKLSAIISPAP